MTDLDKLAHLIYELMGLNQIDEQILEAIEHELVTSYSPIEMEGEDMSTRYYGGVLYGGLDLIKDGKIEFNPLKSLTGKHLEWMLKFSEDGDLRISYMREDAPLQQTWAIHVAFPEWPTKDEGNWFFGDLIIEKSLHQQRIKSATLELSSELAGENLKKVCNLYSLM